MFFELLQIADIVRSAFHDFANLLVLQITVLWVRANPAWALAQQCEEIMQNRLALVRDESVSVGHRWQLAARSIGEPTHAHLHHRQ